MHPAPSIIAFTTLSGLGFGFLIFLGLGLPPVTGWPAFLAFALAYAFATIGLIASTLHLGNPQRALRAFTQWQSSWLSREAVLSVASLLTMGAYGAGLTFAGLRIAPLGWLGAALSLATVFATAMIYAQLKTVPRWNHWTTPALFLLLCLAGGATLAGQTIPAALLHLATGALQILTWSQADHRFAARPTTLATATGLGHLGAVRQFAPPHTGTNYLMKEMVFRIARKHALRLRTIALILMSLAPAALLTLLPGLPGILTALLCHIPGTLTARWLFFAEAEHVVGLYYGAHQGTQ